MFLFFDHLHGCRHGNVVDNALSEAVAHAHGKHAGPDAGVQGEVDGRVAAASRRIKEDLTGRSYLADFLKLF